jgi:hypothetical protein
MTDIARVHVVFKTHLDIGFTDLAAKVKERYLSVFIPRAIGAAEELARRGGPERLIWTTGSWLIDEYLRHAGDGARERAERAIRAGSIAWHALPLTTHTELLDVRLAEFGLSLAARLDARFGRRTIAAKLTDVPGHTIGLVPILARHGIRYLHIGVNGSSRVPEVPPLFRWIAPGGEEIVVQYAASYGGSQAVEGLHDALVVVHGSDNLGPPSASQVLEEMERIRGEFAGAEVFASTLDAFAERLITVRDRLPVVTEEIGDTWIHGAGSDPGKVARYRELLRLRDAWTARGDLDPAGEEYRAFSAEMLMIAEHTWGLDFKKYLGDYRNWSIPEFESARARDRVGLEAVPAQFRFIDEHARRELEQLHPGERRWETRSYSFFESSHLEQRAYLDRALAALPVALREEARAAFRALEPRRAEPAPERVEAGAPIGLGRWTVRFGGDGSIASLLDAAGRERAGGACGFGELRYETFGPEDYAAWHRDYNRDMDRNAAWALADFGKPGIEYARPRPGRGLLAPLVRSLSVRRAADNDEAVMEVRMPQAGAGGAPRTAVIRYRFPNGSPGPIGIVVDWFDKAANRLPEALWFSFGIAVGNPSRWKLVKLGLPLSPFEVVRGGNRSYHAVEEVRYAGADGGCLIRSLDAPIVSPGERKLLRFDDRFADPAGGMHFNLYNNVWGTNFPMWYGEDARFRFEVGFEVRPEAALR